MIELELVLESELERTDGLCFSGLFLILLGSGEYHLLLRFLVIKFIEFSMVDVLL